MPPVHVAEGHLHPADARVERRNARQQRPHMRPRPIRAHDEVEPGLRGAVVEMHRAVAVDLADVRVPADRGGVNRVEQDLAETGAAALGAAGGGGGGGGVGVGPADFGPAVVYAVEVDVLVVEVVDEDEALAVVAGVLCPFGEEAGVLEGLLAGGGVQVEAAALPAD